jgi:hypothetical protein
MNTIRDAVCCPDRAPDFISLGEICMSRTKLVFSFLVAVPFVIGGCTYPAYVPEPAPSVAPVGQGGRRIDGIIDQTILPHLQHYFDRIYQEKAGLTIDGVPAFSESDRFVGGKVIVSMAYALSRTDRTSPEFATRVRMLRDIVEFVSQYEHYATWNHLYALKGLYRLKQEGLLDDVVVESTLAVLKNQLDWRSFVDPTDLRLINYPTNYYGVAVGIARYRELLGWDPEGNSSRILERLLQHVRTYSGEQGFMDETPGEGRFDRYTTLIPAEIAILLTSTETDVPPMIREMLRKSSDIILNLANTQGHGFPYGRSIGLYGDLAPLQILSIAARLNVLNEEEKRAAYAYSTLIVRKYADFWLDAGMHSVNMWDKGRRTDEYRNKGRILGENLSTAMQIVEAAEDWDAAGYDGAPSMAALQSYLQRLPRYRLYRFAEGEYDRALVIARDGEHVFALPLISGARSYYSSTPYLPVPAAVSVLETPPNTNFSHLVPRITLADGRALMPIVYIKDISTEERGDTLVVRYHQDEMALLGETAPRRDRVLSSKTTYVFAPGMMEREDVFRTSSPVRANEVALEFLTSSRQPTTQGRRVAFGEGTISAIEAWGLGDAVVEVLSGDKAIGAPDGPLHNRVLWKRALGPIGDGFAVRWKMTYR